MQRRKGSHGDGEYSFPGGHLEMGETWAHCAIRETFEETGLPMRGRVICVGVTNDVFIEKVRGHYVTIFMYGEAKFADYTIKEPDKLSEMFWVDMTEDAIRSYMPLFLPVHNFLKAGFLTLGFPTAPPRNPNATSPEYTIHEEMGSPIRNDDVEAQEVVDVIADPKTEAKVVLKQPRTLMNLTNLRKFDTTFKVIDELREDWKRNHCR